MPPNHPLQTRTWHPLSSQEEIAGIGRGARPSFYGPRDPRSGGPPRLTGDCSHREPQAAGVDPSRDRATHRSGPPVQAGRPPALGRVRGGVLCGARPDDLFARVLRRDRCPVSDLSWWAILGSNQRPLPCEGTRHSQQNPAVAGISGIGVLPGLTVSDHHRPPVTASAWSVRGLRGGQGRLGAGSFGRTARIVSQKTSNDWAAIMTVPKPEDRNGNG